MFENKTNASELSEKNYLYQVIAIAYTKPEGFSVKNLAFYLYILINLQLWPQRKRSMHNVVNECLIGTRKLFREIKIFFPSFRKTQLKLIWIEDHF